jgi:hypothetical protein
MIILDRVGVGGMKTEVTSSSLASAGGARGEDSAGEAVRAALDGLDGDASFVLCFPSNIDAT